MMRAVRLRCGVVRVFGTLVGLLLIVPAGISAQVVSTQTVKPPPAQVYHLAGDASSASDFVFAEEIPDWKLDPDLPRPVRPAADPLGLERSTAQLFYPDFVSSSLWSNMHDIERFEVGGSHYAVVAMAAGLKFFELGSGAPFFYHRWYSEGGAWRLEIEGTTLYVVDLFDDNVHIFDLSNPASPTLIGTYTPTLTAPILNIAVENDILYLARNADGLEIVDCSNPASPVYLTTWGGTDLNGGQVRDVEVVDGYVLLPLRSTG
ncbi:LVIVD repeat-containing protein, partial [Candidatus Zixiibacteriota bacterium]